MPRSKQSPGLAAEAPVSGLADAIEKLNGQVERLAGHVEGLEQRLQVMIHAIDDFREDIAWALRNDKLACGPGPVMRVTSMPKDPLAADFGQRINRYSAADVPADAEDTEHDDNDDASRHSVPGHQPAEARQGGLWE